jgi:hypothetical protein
MPQFGEIHGFINTADNIDCGLPNSYQESIKSLKHILIGRQLSL